MQAFVCLLCCIVGCNVFREDPRHINLVAEHYLALAEAAVEAAPVIEAQAPTGSLGKARKLEDLSPDDLQPIALVDVLAIALQYSDVIRNNAQFLSPSNPILTAPQTVPSVFDPAIADDSVNNGVRGTDAAKSDFDPRFSTSLIWSKDELVQNNLFLSGGLAPGNVLVEDGAQYRSRLDQSLLTGGNIALVQDWNYSSNNQPNRLFTSAYTGSLGAEFRQPLLAGAGREFISVAGPPDRGNRGPYAVDQGLIIARINRKISELDFEREVQQFVLDVIQAYWDLDLAHREYIAVRNVERSLRDTTIEVQSKFNAGLAGSADEAQAEDAQFAAEARTQETLSGLLVAEMRLRRLMGLPAQYEKVLHPVDLGPPPEGGWNALDSYTIALSERVELRQQKRQIESLCYQLEAAKSLTKPRLDAVAGYRLNGFGDKLISDDQDDGITTDGFGSAYGTMLRSDQTSWNLGFEYTVPLWLRAERAQVRQYELRLAKARAVLVNQELEINHEIAAAVQDLERFSTVFQTNLKREAAARRRLAATSAEFEAGRLTVDLLLRSEISLADAEIATQRSRAEYAKLLAALRYREGLLLTEMGISLRDPYQNLTQTSLGSIRRPVSGQPASNTDPQVDQTDSLPPLEIPPAPGFSETMP